MSFVNPYSQETLIPVGYVSPLNVYFFDVTGSYSRTLPEKRDGHLHLDWRENDAEIWVTESRYNTFPSGVTEAPWAFPEREFGAAAQMRRLRAEGKL